MELKTLVCVLRIKKQTKLTLNYIKQLVELICLINGKRRLQTLY